MTRSFRFTSSRRLYLCLIVSYALLFSVLGPVRPGAAESGQNKAAKYSSTSPSLVPTPAQQTGVRYRGGELLVRFRAGSSELEKTTAVATQGAQRKKKLRGESVLEKLELAAGQDPETVSRLLVLNPAVEFAEPNFLVQLDELRTEVSDARRLIPVVRRDALDSLNPNLNPGRNSAYPREANPLANTSYANNRMAAPLQSSGLQPDDPSFGEQWALRNTGQAGGQYGSDINISTAWQTTTGNLSTIIAVIDSGIDFTHPDLVNNQWTNPLPGSDGDLHGWDYVTDTGAIRDEQGHGTAVAGIIAAQGNNAAGISGVMWRAGLMSLRVLDNTGTGDVANAVEAIDYAVAHGARVINISWGTFGESLVLKDAIERAISHGVVVVCSAGNGGQDIEAAPYYPRIVWHQGSHYCCGQRQL